MGLNIGGATIVKTAGITLNSALVFDASGRGSASPTPGYLAWKAGGSTYYSAPSGWEMNTANWQSADMNLSNGVFTCPVAGLYAIGYNGIHEGGSGVPTGFNTYGYCAFVKNGVMTYWGHWNQGGTPPSTTWHTGGVSAIYSCAAGDTLALLINRSPTQVAPDTYAKNYGMYPDAHHAVWCRLVG